MALAHKLWIGFFSFWLLMISGFLISVTKAPGILQLLATQASIRRQSEKLDLIDKNNIKLEKEIQLIKTNPFYEEREIRRVLGYVKKDEIIFEFKGSGQNSSD